ncbi:hypothetical protein [Falsihalocynthiibacter arcticus]|uniref:Baseplate protein J-like domain-containing protein n=1 Tax=Falsihalocynthiibacter arcticus TaxID=1579316 RepID=A0A126V0V8_9RHOB|nr:hypothetical protein [Falsihalocynthiibacter arcticus]AML51920.1 hypothetical protein RC74_12165 [Falsihalocynthiibacter arcticus]
MAQRPELQLSFTPGDCPDCGSRRADMPPAAVAVPDDIDLTARDFEGLRQLMLESLVLDNPDRQRWSEADLEVAIVEVLAAGLDQMSHSIDVLFAERFLQTARWPRSVVRLLTMIDGVAPAVSALRRLMREDERDRFGFDDPTLAPAGALFAALEAHPQLTETAKFAALEGVNRLVSCISLDDLRDHLREVPLFSQVQVRYLTEGGIAIYEAAILLQDSNWRLVSPIDDLGQFATDFIDYFRDVEADLTPPADGLASGSTGLPALTDTEIRQTSIRAAVTYVLQPLMPIGTRFRLIEGQTIGVYMRLCVEVAPTYFRSEVGAAVRDVLSTGPAGLFQQAKFGFGQPLYVSDIQEALSALEGVEGVIISHLQMVGVPGSEASNVGILIPPANRALALDADNPGPETGYYTLKLSGGLIG